MSRPPRFDSSVGWRVTLREAIHPLMDIHNRTAQLLVPVMRPDGVFILRSDHEHATDSPCQVGMSKGIIGEDLPRRPNGFELLSAAKTCSQPRGEDNKGPGVRGYGRLCGQSMGPEATVSGCT